MKLHRIESFMTEEEKEFYLAYASYKEMHIAGLIQYALERLVTTSPIKELEQPDSLKVATLEAEKVKTLSKSSDKAESGKKEGGKE